MRPGISDDEVQSVIETMRRSKTAFDGQKVFVCFYSFDLTEEGQKGLAAAQEEFGETIDAFEDWKELPKTGTLIGFRVGSRGGLSDDGCCRRQENPPDRPLPRATLQLVWKVLDRPDLQVHSKDMPDWRKIFKNVRLSEYWDKKGYRAVVNLSEVARRFLP